jgi:predicted RNA-binding Zn-ribbon protein involved in translation (DUF1610 family)
MVRSTILTDAFSEYNGDCEKVERLEAIENAIGEIEELGFETYAGRTLAKLKEMKEYCEEEIKEEAEFEGVCPYCGADLDYDDRSDEYVCNECGYNGGYVPDEDKIDELLRS